VLENDEAHIGFFSSGNPYTGQSGERACSELRICNVLNLTRLATTTRAGIFASAHKCRTSQNYIEYMPRSVAVLRSILALWISSTWYRKNPHIFHQDVGDTLQLKILAFNKTCSEKARVAGGGNEVKLPPASESDVNAGENKFNDNARRDSEYEAF
jgi:hypothetical protein